MGTLPGADGELLIWVENGYLSMIEHAWYTLDPPAHLPSPNALVFPPPTSIG